MGKSIFKVDVDGEERFIVWSSIVDAPVTYGCTAEEIVEVFIEDARRDARELAETLLKRARETSSGSRLGTTLADVTSGNRAGPGESALTEDEIIEFYVRRKKEPTVAALAAYRRKR